MKKVFLSAMAAVFCLHLHAQTMAQRLDSLFSAPGNDEHLNGSVLIAENGRIVYQRSFGFADSVHGKPNTAVSSFNIGSTTKTFTATAVLQLMERGKLNLGDAVQKYFPAFPYPEITIRNLLTHTSGLTDLETYFRILDSMPGKVFTGKDIIPSIIRLHRPLKFRPGAQFDYCNLNFELLALLVEHLSGLSYPEYLRRHIFRPAGMTHTYVRGFGPAVDTNAVTNYMLPRWYSTTYVPADSVHDRRLQQLFHNLGGLMGDGNIISTEPDLLRYDQALSAGLLLRPQTLALAYTPVRLINGRDYSFFNDARFGIIRYGLGWMITADTSMGRIVSHGGHEPGIWTSMVRNLTRHQVILIYDNTDWSGADLLSLMALAILNNRPIPPLLSKRSVARVYGQTLLQQGPDAAFCRLIALRADTVRYRLRESDLNTLGYQFLLDGYHPQALETFKVNTLLFPTSANTYDSYGDALAAAGKKAEAAIMYRRCLALNADSPDTKRKLEKLD
jgi:CubicO group peptidase (beta-lactamase class C family)